jgi:hypothetical protein
MRTIAFVICFGFFFQAAAQRECATQAYTTGTKTPGMAAAETFIKQQTRGIAPQVMGNSTGSNKPFIIRIPVVVHLLYNNAAQNISDAQIKSGIAALNRDFRKQNSDTASIPQAFKHLAADVEIEFHLATSDPKGMATTGIVRKATGVPAWNMDDKIKLSVEGGDDAWDSKSYLNIWLGNTRRLLGYATPPGGEEHLDGLVINVTAFGTINTAGPYNLGRTVVHEAGHWLGLHHIWGDEACGDDEVDDTPKQGGYTTGCPTGFRSSCSNGTAGDMFMNYMDFTNDACLNMFTYGQKERMRALFNPGGPRNSLLASTGLNAPSSELMPIEKDSTGTAPGPELQLYPNPAGGEIMVRVAGLVNGTNSLQILNANGILVQQVKITAATQKINLAALQPGVYFVQTMVQNKRIHQKLVKL